MASPLSWHALQAKLVECSTPEQVQELIDAEAAGPCRERWLLRMNSRRSVLRREVEHAEILELVHRAHKQNDVPWNED